ncbi:MAG: hypothetical protein IT365_23995 [Candidatus Hydrogenedentes bacterium]|nr:hypothetical protein [Candidatus Hydrogenedentota bacterium]
MSLTFWKPALAVLVICASGSPSMAQESKSAPPKTIAYNASPTPYFNEHAADVARIYDGFFFTVGSWDEGAGAALGLNSTPPSPTEWKNLVRENLRHLNEAGASANLLGVHFGDSEEWPSPETLLAPEYGDKMAERFGAIAREAKELAFHGLSIDVEYPYPRYALEHPIYTYDGYTAEDLRAAARKEGRAIMNAVLGSFPDAVVFVLPGSLWTRTLARDFQLAMLEVMAERDAPGGFHLGAERSYCLLDPVSQVAIPREGDLSVEALVRDADVRDYWRRRCSVAPGVWPAHMVETGGKDYPARAWAEELADLKQQMHILRNVTKRFIWSFSGQPLWYRHSPEIEAQYGLKKQTYQGIDELVAGWHSILADKSRDVEPRIQPCIDAVADYDQGKIDGAGLCSRLGTPGEWYVLGPLDNPNVRAAYSAPKAFLGAINADNVYRGRDGAVRWTALRNLEPLGHLRMTAFADWCATDNASAQWVATVQAEKNTKAFVHVGWDDGVAVYLNHTLVLDRLAYPERGHGMLYLDKYNFEEKAPIAIPSGKSRLTVICVNGKGNWGVNLRIADENACPISGITFPPLREGSWESIAAEY